MSGTIDGPASGALVPLAYYAWCPAVAMPARTARCLRHGIQNVDMCLKEASDPHSNIRQVLIPHTITVMCHRCTGDGLDVHAAVIRRKFDTNSPMVSIPPFRTLHYHNVRAHARRSNAIGSQHNADQSTGEIGLRHGEWRTGTAAPGPRTRQFMLHSQQISSRPMVVTVGCRVDTGGKNALAVLPVKHNQIIDDGWGAPRVSDRQSPPAQCPVPAGVIENGPRVSTGNRMPIAARDVTRQRQFGVITKNRHPDRSM
jgi:hypothetical protein